MPVNGSCPNCGGALVELERSGVHIDACRQCRGVFLERGELDTLIARERDASAGDDDDFLREVTGGPQRERYGIDKQHAERLYEDYRHKRKHKKRKSFLEEIFD